MPSGRAADAHEAIGRLEAERIELGARLALLQQSLPGAEAAAEHACTVAEQAERRLAGEMEGESHFAGTLFKMREQCAAAQSARVRAQGELDRIRRHSRDLQLRIDHIAEEIDAWRLHVSEE